MQMMPPRIFLIHATALAVDPVSQAFARLWPQVRLDNLLDDSLSADLAAAGCLSDAMHARIRTLARYARDNGADGILFTCSAFGPAIDAAAQDLGVPTLKPNEAMFEDAIALCAQAGPGARAGLLTTFAPAAASMQLEFEQMVRSRGVAPASVPLDCACADGAMALLQAGQTETHDQAIAAAAADLTGACVLMLGQFSMARAQPAVHAATGRPVLTSPESAVRKLQRALS